MNPGETVLWEYKVLDVIDPLAQAPAEAVLNELGRQGWELTGVDASLSDCPRYVFKRQVASLEPAPDLDDAEDRWLQNVSMAEALLALPAEKREELFMEVLTEEERACASPPDDFRERVLLYFAQKREGA